MTYEKSLFNRYSPIYTNISFCLLLTTIKKPRIHQARRRFSRDQHATVSGDLKTVLSAY